MKLMHKYSSKVIFRAPHTFAAAKRSAVPFNLLTDYVGICLCFSK